MTPAELIRQIRPLSLAEKLDVLADHALIVKRNGHVLFNIDDFTGWLHDLAEEARHPSVPQSGGEKPGEVFLDKLRSGELPTAPFGNAAPKPPEHKHCPRCGHIHEGVRECGADMGGGRICRCEMEVAA